MKRVLFVDDEPKVLDGLRRMLRCMRHTWSMEFAEGGAAALEILRTNPADVVVTDMRMPGMDGAAFLREVMVECPSAARIILSGQCDRETVLNTVCLAHQFLTKPSDPVTLKHTVGRACDLRDQLPNERYREIVSCMKALPSDPRLYKDICSELDSSDGSIARIANWIADDVGMAVKILQLVNSSFFGSPQRLYDPARAASLFDLDTLRALFHRTEAFAPFTAVPRLLSPDVLEEHSRQVAALAAEIAKNETQSDAFAEKAYLAGLLHDTGLLLLSEREPESYSRILAKTIERQSAFWDEEYAEMQTTHAAVGAYLLGLWGIDDEIVRAVANHHRPSCSTDTEFTLLTAIHVAEAFSRDACTGMLKQEAWLDEEYLERLGLAHRLPTWEQICQQHSRTGEAP